MVKSNEPLLTATLLKASRALLGMDQAALAAAVGVSRKTIAWIEVSASENVDPRRRATLEKIRDHLEDELGLQFRFQTEAHGEGVYLRHPRR